LFLLISDEFGRDSIRRIMEQIQKEDYLNGRDLIRVVNDVLGVDIEGLAEEFSFPEIGWKTTELTRAVILNESLDVGEGVLITEVDPNGAAGEAGFRKDDTILRVGDRPIKNEMDLELAIYDSLAAREMDVTIWRKDGGEEVIGLRFDDI
jgi:S1-C subfamily serine protease